MAAFIRRNDLSNGLIRPIRLSESTRLHSYPFKSNHAYMACKFAKETLVLCHSHISQIKYIYISYGTHKYPAEFTNIVVINITPVIYLYAFAPFSQKPLSNYIRKNSYYRITIITQSVYLYAFASFSQKPLLNFIYEYEHELSYNI